MKLYDSFAVLMLNQLNATAGANGIGTQGSIDFFVSTTNLNGLTGIMGASSRVMFSSTPVGTFSTSGDFTTGTRCTAVFNAMTTGTVATTGTAAYFAILNTNATATTGNIVLTGSVGTSASDINFNVVGWDTGDNISITSLTFVQPR